MDAHHSNWERDNHERLLKWRQGYYQSNREKQIAQAETWNTEHAEQVRETWTSRYHKLRHATFMAYGGYECACCGETEPLFLSIDHVNNDQCEKAKEFGRPHTGSFLYKWLRDNGYPEGYQVLCHNCNQGKRLNGGICPHQVNKA